MTSQPVTGAATDRVRLGILGLGAVAQAVHLPLLARLPSQFEIAALADLSPSVTDAIGERYGVPAERRHRSLDALLESRALDALMILTSGSHGPAILAGFDAGLAVFAEKPVAFTLAEADAIAARMSGDARLRLQVGYMKLYDPAVVRARQAAGTEGFGPPRAIEVTVLHPTSESQLAHARLLPPPADIASEVRAALVAEVDGLRAVALGEQAAVAIGRTYTEILLGSVVHELALVRAFSGDPIAIDDAITWPDGAWPPSVRIGGRLPHDGRMSIAWHFLPEYPEYREEVRVIYGAASSELSFPSPYLLHRPTVLRTAVADGDARRDSVWTSTVEAFEEELLGFHALVTDGRAPAAGLLEGRADIVTCQRIAAVLARGAGVAIGGEAVGIGPSA